ncbi:glycerophosphodiester phosphodiesterase [Kangiella sediminilitoris]|uniref:Glycerophosphodiester phosphodiesterase n=1 Tax=Kangiella sediminilitoris TaxID=1144748 RepID=A0A1B3B9J9_9GAMM|nr:glycerophosphodiester phosphodiesterase family protein [Kangiella sediminilitoris]AOE49467.1 Glycerophosphodiester phosphodiesterase [Kangiella sediminilitoris]
MTAEFKVIGHRGALGLEPENTLRSIQRALEIGVDGVEFDVQNIDGRLFIFHDDTLDRTTNGKGKLIEHSVEELRRLDAGKGEKIPFLSEVVELIGNQAFINIELKGLDTASLVMDLVELLDKDRFKKEQFIISSYHFSELYLVQQLDTEIQLGVIADDQPVVALDFADEINAYSFHPSFSLLSRDLVEEAHSMGMKVYVHTVNDLDKIRQAREWGVDGVFTDYPDRVKKYCTE